MRKLVLRKAGDRYIADLDKSVYRDHPFDCPDDIARKIMAHGDYEDITEVQSNVCDKPGTIDGDIELSGKATSRRGRRSTIPDAAIIESGAV